MTRTELEELVEQEFIQDQQRMWQEREDNGNDDNGLSE